LYELFPKIGYSIHSKKAKKISKKWIDQTCEKPVDKLEQLIEMKNFSKNDFLSSL